MLCIASCYDALTGSVVCCNVSCCVLLGVVPCCSVLLRVVLFRAAVFCAVLGLPLLVKSGLLYSVLLCFVRCRAELRCSALCCSASLCVALLCSVLFCVVLLRSALFLVVPLRSVFILFCYVLLYLVMF